MNPEIDKKFRAIRRKCNYNPDKYPTYCKRAVLDILALLNDMREETAAQQNSIDNLYHVYKPNRMNLLDGTIGNHEDRITGLEEVALILRAKLEPETLTGDAMDRAEHLALHRTEPEN